MKKAFFILLFLLFFPLHSLFAKNLKAYFSYGTFYSPEDGPYIETYLSIEGNSVFYTKNENEKLQSIVEITLIFKQGEEIKDFRKYKLLSPELPDTTHGIVDFIDQQRIALPNGIYQLEILMVAQHSSQPPFSAKQTIEINYSTSKIAISDIELIETITKTTEENILSKSGYDLVPYVSDYYPETIEKIIFYAEIYNADKALEQDTSFLLNCYIASYEKGIIINDLKQSVKQFPQSVNVVLKKFDISNLPSGNYNLVIEVINKNNELLTKKELFIQRSNPSLQHDREDFSLLHTSNSFVDKINSKDTLVEYIRCLRPISTTLELSYADNQLKSCNLQMAQRFFLSFWINKDPLNPEQAWLDYKLEVEKVDNDFSTSIKKGYETDRGRIYLKYGPPNIRAVRKNEPNAYPYEIWHYYKIPEQADAKFVFYDYDLVSNDYALLHSNVRGEINNYRWLIDLNRRNETNTNVDLRKGQDYWGSQAEDLYNNPR